MSEVHPNTRARLLAAAGYKCAYCGTDIAPRRAGPNPDGSGWLPDDAATLDHTLSRTGLILAGLPRWALTAASCWRCNAAAGAPLELEDLGGPAVIAGLHRLWTGEERFMRPYLRTLADIRGMLPARIATRQDGRGR